MARSKLEDLPGVGPATAKKLEEAGFNSIEAIAVSSPSEFAGITGCTESTAKKIVISARRAVGLETNGTEDTISEGVPLECIRVEFKTHDVFDEEFAGSEVDEFECKINNFNWKFFEVHRGSEKIPDLKLPSGAVIRGGGKATLVSQYPIQDITIKGSFGFNKVTLYFGDFGHIHLSMKTAKAFLKGFENVYNGMVESRRILKEEGRLIEERG